MSPQFLNTNSLPINWEKGQAAYPGMPPLPCGYSSGADLLLLVRQFPARVGDIV